MHCIKYPEIWVFTGPFSPVCSDVLQDIPHPNSSFMNFND